jgi:hypothetical protein
LKKNISNKNIFIQRFNLLFLLIIIIISSCSPTKYVPGNETLLDKNHVVINNEGISKTDLLPYIKQQPNKRIFGAKFYLGLYNLSNINKEKWPHTWLRNIGEEPVIYDPFATEKTLDDLQSYIASKGYFDSKVVDTTETEKRKTEVFYNVNLKTPYTIRSLIFEFADTVLMEFFYDRDSVNCLIQRGQPYDVDVLQSERTRLERLIKDQGYYGFSGDHISFRADSTVGNRQVDIFYEVKESLKLDAFGRITSVPHSLYYIRNVYIYPDFVPKDALEGGEAYTKNLDTTIYENYYFISPGGKPEIKYDMIIQSLYFKPGSRYSVTRTEQTQAHLSSLKTFRLTNIYFNEISDKDIKNGSGKRLDCIIQLTLLSQQSYKVEVEGTHTGGDLGGALNLGYQHKNLFRGAEQFNLTLKGAYERLSQQTSGLHSSLEYGAETSLRFPKFLVPFVKTEGFIQKYHPTTTLLAAYNRQKMPFYTRTMANATFGYNWNGNSYTTHIVNPVQLNFVKLDTIDAAFWERIKSTSLAYSYSDVIILGASYSLIFSNQNIGRTRDRWGYWFVRFNGEASGNLLGAISNILKATKTEGSYQIFNQPYAQYIRADIDFRYNVNLNDVSSLVFRGFAGAGIPYGNSRAIPFEKQYFGGGANGVRAWQVRTLGPGHIVPDRSEIQNQTADIKIEANAEYRFNLFWILESAVFLDAGNIWSVASESPSETKISTNFYKDFAVGTGFGLRFDLDFVLLRADVGIKLRDPSLEEGSRWITDWADYYRATEYIDNAGNKKHAGIFGLVVGIGYPF